MRTEQKTKGRQRKYSCINCGNIRFGGHDIYCVCGGKMGRTKYRTSHRREQFIKSWFKLKGGTQCESFTR